MTSDPICVEAAGRLHFGVLDLRGSFGRWFGGIGAPAPGPTLLLSVEAADTLDVRGEDADRAGDFARRFLSHHGIRGGASIVVHRALRPHAGLGSGTQLALAVARALADLHGIDADAASLARAVGRARRSAIGTWTFAGGGLVVEGGVRRDREEPGPLIARVPLPSSWRCVLAVPDGAPGISGTDEAAAFAELPPPSPREVEQVAHVVLMALLPAAAEGDLPAFGSALTCVQEITGRWFAPIQGGTFAPGPGRELLRRMQEWGATGVGQSSWGPAVYGIVDGEAAGRRLLERVRDAIGGHGVVYEDAFRTDGARVWRGRIGT